VDDILNIIITTYSGVNRERLGVAYQTIQGLRDFLVYSGPIRWILADDGSVDGFINNLLLLLEGREVQVTQAGRGGIGRSKNLALWQAFEHSDLVLLTEDDWKLIQPLNIDQYISVLTNEPSVGIIRLGYQATDVKAEYVGYPGNICYWKLAQGSGVYVYSGQVSLRHRRFYDKVGWHKEGVAPGAEELEMCIRYNGTEGAPCILWPGDISSHFQSGPFKNIGLDSSLNGVNPG
jgi:hypothetical protein